MPDVVADVLACLPDDGSWRMQSHNFPLGPEHHDGLRLLVQAGLVETDDAAEGLLSKWRRRVPVAVEGGDV